MENKQSKATFKPYSVSQGTLLPPYLDELIPKSHLVRVVNEVIDRLDLTPLYELYPGGGASSYHPAMLLKVLVYAYTERTYSSRRIAKALRENINFMWLSGRQKPDFRTIARFRSGRLKRVIEQVFAEVVLLMIDSGHLKLDNYFLDGTKLEADAGKYTWIWGKNNRRYHQRLKKQIAKLLSDIDEAEAAEQAAYGDKDLEEVGDDDNDIDSGMLSQAAERISERLKGEPNNKDLKRASKKIEKDYLPRLKKYENQHSQLGGRNSCSKTDPDATFMRMKEDHMRNGQLKPGYNIQIGAANQFIVDYSVHQNASDSACLIAHLDKSKKNLGRSPRRLIADAAYGSEQNYRYLENKGIAGYVKYSRFDRERKRSFRDNEFEPANWPYDAERDEYRCPAGKALSLSEERVRRTGTGYQARVKVYRCADCGDCEHGRLKRCRYWNKCLQRSPQLEQYKAKARERLISEEGGELRRQRGMQVETPYGQIKQNMGFRRFMLRGIEKVSTEWGLLSLAHNMIKLSLAQAR